MLAVPQQDLNLFRGVFLALIDDLEQAEQRQEAFGWRLLAGDLVAFSPPAHAQAM